MISGWESLVPSIDHSEELHLKNEIKYWIKIKHKYTVFIFYLFVLTFLQQSLFW